MCSFFFSITTKNIPRFSVLSFLVCLAVHCLFSIVDYWNNTTHSVDHLWSSYASIARSWQGRRQSCNSVVTDFLDPIHHNCCCFLHNQSHYRSKSPLFLLRLLIEYILVYLQILIIRLTFKLARLINAHNRSIV